MVVCRLCGQEFPSTWKLNVHLKSSKHQRQTVICPWCPVERTYTRTVDLRNHCEKSHAVETKRLGSSFFSSGNCFYLSIYPEDYAVICNVEEWTSKNAMEARRLIEKWVEWQPGSKIKKEVWRKGWKNGVRLAAEHRGRIQSDKENEVGETEEIVDTEGETERNRDRDVHEFHDRDRGEEMNEKKVLKEKSDETVNRQVVLNAVVDIREEKSDKVLQNEKTENENVKSEKVLEINVKEKQERGRDSEKLVDVTDNSGENSKSLGSEVKCKIVGSANVLNESVEKESAIGTKVVNLIEVNDRKNERENDVKRNGEDIVINNEDNEVKEKDDNKVELAKATSSVLENAILKTGGIEGSEVDNARVLIEKEIVEGSILLKEGNAEANAEVQQAVKSIMPEDHEDIDKPKIPNGDSANIFESCENVNKREKQRKHKHKKDKKEKKLKKSKRLVPTDKENKRTVSFDLVKEETLPSVRAEAIDEYIVDLKFGLDDISSGMATPLIDEKPREHDIEGELSIVSELLSEEAEKEKKGLKRSVGQENIQKKRVKISTDEYRARKGEKGKSMPIADGEVGVVNSKGENVILRQGEDMIWYRSKVKRVTEDVEGTKAVQSATDSNEKKKDSTENISEPVSKKVNSIEAKIENRKDIQENSVLDLDEIEGRKNNNREKENNLESALERETANNLEHDIDNTTFTACVTSENTDDGSNSYIERARYILKRGVMPLCPPAYRQWSTDNSSKVSIPIGGSHALIWPPAAWEAMTPDRKLMSAESAAMTLESCMYSYVDPGMSRAYLMDKYRYLLLPGSARFHKEVAEEASNKARCYLYHVMREIANGKQPSASERDQLVMLETVSANQVIDIDPSSINIPLRLGKSEN